MNDLSPDGRRLFRSARADLEPHADDRSRNGRAIAVRLGVAAASLTGTASVASASVGTVAGGIGGVAAAGSRAALLVAAKWMSTGLVVGLGASSAYLAVREPASVPKSMPASSVSALSSTSKPRALDGPGVSEHDEPGPLPLAPVAPLPSHGGRALPGPAASVTEEQTSTPTPTPPIGTVSEEARRLRLAHEALRDGKLVRALALLDEHARYFPNSVLAEERSAERVATLCKLGRAQEARAEARGFLAATPDSPLAKGVRAGCGAGFEGKAP